MARALIAENLFPVCEDSPSAAVKLLLESPASAPLAGHREPRDRRAARGTAAESPATMRPATGLLDRCHQKAKPVASRRSRRPGSPTMKPMPTQVGSLSPLEPSFDRSTGADAHHEPGRDRDDEQRPERRSSSRQRPGRVGASDATRTQRRRSIAPKSTIAPSTCRKSGQERAADGGDHCARLPDHLDRGSAAAWRARRARTSRCRAGSRSSARSSSVGVSPAARELLGELRRAFSWCLPPSAAERARRSPRGRARPTIQKLKKRVAQLVDEPEAEDERRRPSRAPISGSGDADQARAATPSRSAARPGAPACSASPAATEPPTKQERARDVQHQQPVERAHGARAYAFRPDGNTRPAPEAPDRDDRGRQLDARPAGGAVAGRDERCDGARGRRLFRLPLRRARGRARPARDARHARRRDDAAGRACGPARGSPARPRPPARR